MILTPAADAERLVGGGRERAAAVLGRDDVVGVDLLLDGVSVEPRRPAPSVATTVTSARPIISAAAVEAVRPGLRSAFSRASRPGEPPKRAAGGRRASRAASPGAGRAWRCRRTARARRRDEACSAIATPPNRPSRDQRQRDADDRRARRTGLRPGPADVVAVEPSRTAEIGGTRVARRAGTMLATSVTIVPVSRLTITVRVCEHRAGLRQVDAHRGEQRAHALGDADAEQEADAPTRAGRRSGPRARPSA